MEIHLTRGQLKTWKKKVKFYNLLKCVIYLNLSSQQAPLYNFSLTGEAPMDIDDSNDEGTSFEKPSNQTMSIPGLDATPVTFKCTMCAVSFPKKLVTINKLINIVNSSPG